MQVSVEKPGSPEELVHFGKKGMKWGVRNVREAMGTGRSAGQAPKPGMSTKKKLLIGAGVTVGVAATAFAVYKLNQSGKLPISSIKDRVRPNATRSLLRLHGNKPTSSISSLYSSKNQSPEMINLQKKLYENMTDASRQTFEIRQRRADFLR